MPLDKTERPVRRAQARRASGAVALLAALVLLGGFLPLYWVYLLATAAISALVARSIGLVTNRVGIITLCQMSFAAIGGWVVSWLALAWPGAHFPVLVLLGGLAAGPVGLVIGAVTTRIRGAELAVVTLGFAAALDLVLRQWGFPGVGTGTPVLPSAPFSDPRWFFALAWTLLILLHLCLTALSRTRLGSGWSVLRASERSAAALGVRVVAAKSAAFGAGALVAGVAGGLLAGQYGLLTTAVFTPLSSMVHLATAVLCGASVLGGAVLAGLFTVLVPEALRRLGLPLDLGNIIFALGAFDVLRRGNGGIWEQLSAGLQDRAFRDVRAVCQPTARSRGVEGASECGAVARPPSRPPALQARGLGVRLGGHRVLDSVEVVVASGEVHALIGPNGAGKSTFIDAVTGFLPAYEGTIRVGGAPIDPLSASARALGGVRRTFQQSRVNGSSTVDEYLRLAAGSRSPSSIPLVRELFGLPEGRLPIRLMDAGSRRILEVAGALAARPRLLLLDEPAAGLDDAVSRELAAVLRGIPAEFDCAVLVIEHDMEFVRAAASRTTVLDEGRIVGSGPTSEILRDPRVIAAYLGKGGGA
ncbi:branched-chain amino acid ABC transporter ATP-binding protein/permease [Leucobacter weissii]|uniref:Branched-chain amino acid ABC transporter ATP-binding protein/permease n=1 Tax=Leucobacter weissii TaxID=1983706 RepID=A0A939MLK6_9MICO|nr:ATP-binding cassette domain-containing protein [Leucobacter weissii]MBO1902806.1 branched-chain amino acid ABC transporter ATP-binding protein/permease [Leucobacter weissii]